jgi:hypothetical protein
MPVVTTPNRLTRFLNWLLWRPKKAPKRKPPKKRGK